MSPRLLVFDSGIGGLSVLREIRAAMPGAEAIYVADDAAFPYGGREETALAARISGLMAALIADYRPDLVVIACNTASTLVMPALRARHALPFVGTVPAIKPAAERTVSGLVSVLATPGTIARDYTRELIRTYAARVEVTLVGSPVLASLAEARMRGEAVADDAVAAAIAPCFVDRAGRRTDTVVLACTHYPFLLDAFVRLAPWPVNWIDPAPAIARRVATLAAALPLPDEPATAAGGGMACLTSGKLWPPALLPVLASLGLAAAGSAPVRDMGAIDAANSSLTGAGAGASPGRAAGGR